MSTEADKTTIRLTANRVQDMMREIRIARNDDARIKRLAEFTVEERWALETAEEALAFANALMHAVARGAVDGAVDRVTSGELRHALREAAPWWVDPEALFSDAPKGIMR